MTDTGEQDTRGKMLNLKYEGETRESIYELSMMLTIAVKRHRRLFWPYRAIDIRGERTARQLRELSYGA